MSLALKSGDWLVILAAMVLVVYLFLALWSSSKGQPDYSQWR
jgi:hypothetical protein